jgi:hypothetical protein
MTRCLPRLLVALSLALTACGGAEEAGPRATGTPSPSPSPPATPSPSPSPTADGTALAIAAVDAAGRAVILDAGSGEVRRVLLEGIAIDDPAANAIAVTPDRRTVFVVRPGASGEQDTRIVQVPASGGAPQPVAPGIAPAVSPDGSTLAYVRYVGDGPGQREPTIRLRALSNGSERELRGGDFYGIWDLAWTGNGSRLAFTAGEIKTGVHVVDPTAGSLEGSRRLGPEDRDATWSGVATLAGDRIAVIDRCCTVPDPDPQRWRVLSVDTGTGTVGKEVFGRERTEAFRLDSRSDGQGLLVVQEGRPGGSPLLRWDGSGELREVAADIVVAAW